MRRRRGIRVWGEALDEDDLEQVLSLARAVVDWAAKIIETRPPTE
jgi:hypothetical protein